MARLVRVELTVTSVTDEFRRCPQSSPELDRQQPQTNVDVGLVNPSRR